jgi:hypothetical protein
VGWGGDSHEVVLGGDPVDLIERGAEIAEELGYVVVEREVTETTGRLVVEGEDGGLIAIHCQSVCSGVSGVVVDGTGTAAAVAHGFHNRLVSASGTSPVGGDGLGR